MSIKARGEAEIELCGKKYKLRSTFAALLETESKLNAGLPSVFIKAANSDLGFKDIAAVIYGGMIGAGNKRISFDEVGELVLEHGISKLFLPVIKYLKAAVYPHSEIDLEETERESLPLEKKTKLKESQT